MKNIKKYYQFMYVVEINGSGAVGKRGALPSFELFWDLFSFMKFPRASRDIGVIAPISQLSRGKLPKEITSSFGDE
jgi:hypothetical protein